MRTATQGARPMPASREHCIGVSLDGMCDERKTCALHIRQIADPHPKPMLLARVGDNQCHYRVEVAE